MKGRRLLITLAAATLVVGLTVLARLPSARPQQLPDGALVALRRLKFGPTNVFTHGRALERMLGNVIPSNGLRIARFQLQRPTERVNIRAADVPLLSAEFQLSGPEIDAGRSSPVTSPKFYRQFRMVILGEDDFPYVEEFEQIQRYGDGVYVYVNTTAFSRSSRILRFQLQQHDDRLGPWRTVAEFVRKNPVRAKEKEWTPESFPITRTADGIQFVLGEVTVQPSHSNAWENFWQSTVTIPLRVTHGGVLLTNWSLHDLRAEDSSGNSLYLFAQKTVSEDGVLCRTFRSVDPAKVWRLRGGLSPDSPYATSNLFTLHVPIPLAASFTTNLGGHLLKVGFVNTDMLSVDLLNEAPDLRLVFVEARDEEGKNIGEHSGSWGQFRFWKMLALPSLRSPTPPPPGAKILATIAISRNVPVEFTVRPRLIGSHQTSTNR
jgi:hypothetical protein